jgi:hypothetical protein
MAWIAFWDSVKFLQALFLLAVDKEAMDSLQYLESFRHHASCNIDPEFIEDREKLWRGHVQDLDHAPPLMTLQPDESLACWKDIIMNELLIDHKACFVFVLLVRKGCLGHQEGCRILHHLFKDNMDQSWHRCPSTWMYRCCTEGTEAIEHYDEWNSGPSGQQRPSKGKGKGKDDKKDKGKGHETSKCASISTWGASSSSDRRGIR